MKSKSAKYIEAFFSFLPIVLDEFITYGKKYLKKVIKDEKDILA